MNDIVERLREFGTEQSLYPLCTEAANEIERWREMHDTALRRNRFLESECERLRAAHHNAESNVLVLSGEVERLTAALQQIAHDKTEIGYAQHIARAALEGK